MKNILDKIAELPSGFVQITLGGEIQATADFTVDDLQALASHLKKMEEMLAQAVEIEFDDHRIYPIEPDDDSGLRRRLWYNDVEEDGYPDALTAFESLKEQQ